MSPGTAHRLRLATALDGREQARHRLLLILVVVLPLYLISRSIAITLPTPRTIPLPGGESAHTTMRDLHGAGMASITIGFLAGLCGQFMMRTAFEADRRLVIAGFRPIEALLPRLLVLTVMVAIVVAVSMIVTAFGFRPESWPRFVLGGSLMGTTYGAIGVLAGSLLGRLGGTYFMFFMPMLDIGIAQNPMFGDAEPSGWAALLPGYGANRVSIDAAFSESFHAGSELAAAIGWSVFGAAIIVGVLLRALRERRH